MRNVIALALVVNSLPAYAQDEVGAEGAVEGGMVDDAADSRRRARDGEEDVVREIVRGLYLKSSIGSGIFAPVNGVRLGGVMAVGISMGSDIIDRERFSVAIEGELAQGLFNGPPSAEQVIAAGPVVQGDIHTIAGTVAAEASIYVSRRFGVGGRVGGGVLYAPVLVALDTYQNEFRGSSQWNGQNALFHNGTLPMGLAGLTIEYYTKLSHFSIGADADLNVLIASTTAFSVRPVGYLKYTF